MCTPEPCDSDSFVSITPSPFVSRSRQRSGETVAYRSPLYQRMSWNVSETRSLKSSRMSVDLSAMPSPFVSSMR